MARCLVSLGTNLGERLENICKAGLRLEYAFGVDRVRFSKIYQTPPVGGPRGQDFFLNAVAAIDTDLDVYEVWGRLREIERDLGRTRQLRWEARKLDLDVVLYDDLRLWSPHFKVPHPRMCMRTFVLTPAAEIVPDWVDPVTTQTVEGLAMQLNDRPIRLAVVCEDVVQLQRLAKELASQFGIDENWICVRKVENGLAEYQIEIGSAAIVRLFPLDDARPAKDRSAAMSNSSEVDRWREAVSSWVVDVRPQLLMLSASSSSDPAVAWEDATSGWAKALGIAPSPILLEGLSSMPRYLLIADDPKWAAHEIQAAIRGMTCGLDPTEWSLGS